MRTVRAFVRDHPGRWLWAAAVVALSALLPEYLSPVLYLVAFIVTLRGERVPFTVAEKAAFVFYGWLLIGVAYSPARVSALANLFLFAFFLLSLVEQL